MTTPHVHVVATGGTIASHHDGENWTDLTGAQLVDELGLHRTHVSVSDVAAGPSSSLDVDDMVAIAHHVQAAISEGADGVVVTHGTDTLELTAFVCELVLGSRPGVPVVFTGAMRVHSHPEADGPGNLRDAIRLAASKRAHGQSVLVCLDGTIHDARRVRKVDASRLSAFVSIPGPPRGSFASDGPRLAATPVLRSVPAVRFACDVPLITVYPSMSPDVLRVLVECAAGVVLEVFGDLNVPLNLWSAVHEVARSGLLVVLASSAYTPTYRDEGLDMFGVLGAGGLSAQKARLALMAAIGTVGWDDAVHFLADLRVPFDPAVH